MSIVIKEEENVVYREPYKGDIYESALSCSGCGKGLAKIINTHTDQEFYYKVSALCECGDKAYAKSFKGYVAFDDSDESYVIDTETVDGKIDDGDRSYIQIVLHTKSK